MNDPTGEPMERLFLEDFSVGMTFMVPPPYHVRKDEIISFARYWDPQAFHVDDASASASIYGEIIACSAHIFSIFTKLSSQIQPPSAAIGALGFDDVRIPNPVRAGDALELFCECIVARRSKSAPGRGVVSSRVWMKNQRDQVVFSGISTFLIESRDMKGGNA
jgi:acyl dehydratase